MSEPAIAIDVDTLEWLPAAAFASLVGWTIRKVQSKIERQTWIENVHFRYDPDGEIHVHLPGYKLWVQSGTGSKRGRQASRSGLTIAASAAGKPSKSLQRKLT